MHIECFVYRIDEDVVLAEIVKIDAVKFSGVVQIQLHPRRRHDVAEARRNLEDATAIAHAFRLERRRYRKADGFATAFGIRDHEVGRHRIEPAHDALARGIKRFQVNDEIPSIFYMLHLLHTHIVFLRQILSLIYQICNIEVNNKCLAVQRIALRQMEIHLHRLWFDGEQQALDVAFV